MAFGLLDGKFENVTDGGTGNFNEHDWTNQLGLLLMKEWIAGLQLNVPYLGARFSASDAGVVGGVLLFVAGIWAFYAARRENHSVYFLIKDVKEFNFSDAGKFYLRGELHATQLFSRRVKNSKGAYTTARLERKDTRRYDSPKIGDNTRRRDGELIWSSVLMEKILGKIQVFLFMLPALSLTFVLAVDILTLFARSPFRADKEILIEVVCKGEGFLACGGGSLAARFSISAVFVVLVYVVMRSAYTYHRATELLIEWTSEWKDLALNLLIAEVSTEDTGGEIIKEAGNYLTPSTFDSQEAEHTPTGP